MTQILSDTMRMFSEMSEMQKNAYHARVPGALLHLRIIGFALNFIFSSTEQFFRSCWNVRHFCVLFDF